ncbi:MAG: hypothetical protein GY711_22430 [bacterium]|nr:hypothetical protein [bacterium]
MKRLALLSLVWLAASGCFFQRTHVNQPIEPARLDQLQPGTSTARDVVEALGAPTDVVQLGKRSAYRYDHKVEKQTGLFLLVLGLRGVDSNADRVWAFFDENDVLTHVGATIEAAEAGYGVPVFQDPD